MAEARSFARRATAFANRRIGKDPVPSGAAIFRAPCPRLLGYDGVGRLLGDSSLRL